MIRLAKKSDAKRIVEIESECFPKEEAASGKSIIERLETFSQSFLVYENAGGEIIGFINGMVINQRHITDELFDDINLHDENGDWQSVFGLDVQNEYRHKGYAKELMNQLISQAKKHGRKGCTLTCEEHLIDFYSSFGYKNEGVSKSVHGGAVWYDMVLEF